MLNILLVVLLILGELEQGWSLGLRFAQVNKFPPKRQNTKQNEAPQTTCDCFGPVDPDSWKPLSPAQSLLCLLQSLTFLLTLSPSSAPKGVWPWDSNLSPPLGGLALRTFPWCSLGILDPCHGPLDALFSTLAHQSGAARKMLHWDCSSSIIHDFSTKFVFCSKPLVNWSKPCRIRWNSWTNPRSWNLFFYFLCCWVLPGVSHSAASPGAVQLLGQAAVEYLGWRERGVLRLSPR